MRKASNEIPEYIKNKMRQMIRHGRRRKKLEAEVYEWFEKQGLDTESPNADCSKGENGFDGTINDTLIDATYGRGEIEEAIESVQKDYVWLMEVSKDEST